MAKGSVSARIIKIAILAVAMGMAMILIAVATGKGLQKDIQNKTAAFNGHLVVSPFENSESQISVLPIADNSDLYGMLQNELGVLHVQKVAMKGGLLKSEADFEGIVYKGVASDYKWENLEGFMVEGRFPRFMDRPSKEIIISKVIADRLSVAVGDELTAYFQNSLQQKVPNIRKFEVTGLFLSGFPDFDQNFVIGDLQHVQRINKWNPEEIGAYEVFTSDITALQSIANSIYAKLPSDLDAVEITRQYATIFQWISLFDFNILIIIIVMIIVGVINMSTALLVLILERTRMIGLFKTIGAGNRLIRKIFLYNGIVIMGYGLFWGNLTGLLFYFSQKYFGWIRLDPETYYVNTAPVSLNLFDLLSINAGVLIVSSLLLLIPLAIISSIRPARVLRYR
tara:strand:+ start:7667 stop:8857 length:1191 start_codon:yes stop_codon:yes gene_type:complete